MRIDSVPPLVVDPTASSGALYTDASARPRIVRRTVQAHPHDLGLHAPHAGEHYRISERKVVADGPSGCSGFESIVLCMADSMIEPSGI